MSRLIVAVLILFAVLAGLRFANASLFQRNVANRIDSSASDTRTTGFSADSTGASPRAGIAPQSTAPQTGVAAETTPLPPAQQRAIPGNW